MPPNLLWKIGSTYLLLITSPRDVKSLIIASKCEYGSALHIAGSIDLSLFDSNLLTFKVIVWELDLMVIVDTKHTLCSNSQAKASIRELPNFDLEYSWFGNGFLCDKIYPIINKSPFNSKSVSPGSKGKTLVIRVMWMWGYNLIIFNKRLSHKAAHRIRIGA